MNGNDLRTEKASMTDGTETEPLRWNFIEWDKVEAHVNRLQTKIAKAASEGREEEVRRTQRRLTHSFYAKLLAVKRVTSNRGRKTPGVDGEIWDTPAKKMRAAQALESKGYKAKPLRRVHIPKKGKSGKTRPLGIPTMHDRAMQALYALALEPVAETTGDRHSYGFRKGRCAQDASQQLYNVLSKKYSPKWVLEGDIKGCFDHISHEWLMENIPMDKKVLEQFLKAGFMEQGSWHETEEGTPQGGIISPILANMALDGMDRALDEKYHTSLKGKLSREVKCRNKVNLVRYADDFVITAKSEEAAKGIKGLVAEFLGERGLELSAEKTLVTHIDDGFDFLGWNFRKYDGKMLVTPSKESVKRFLREVHHAILRTGLMWKQDELIGMLEPKIRGFANYHRHTCAGRTFGEIDHYMYIMYKRWAIRRHPHKNWHWRNEKYWCKLGNRKYVFGNEKYHAPQMSWQHIVRHLPLKHEMNPYLNPEYFAERKERLRMRNQKSFRRAAAR